MRRVLFVCVRNAGRSVMAEAFYNALAGPDATATSAGTDPSERPHAEVVDAMSEIGIDVSGHRGRPLTNDLVESADRIVTMGCAVDEALCPAIRLADVEDWALEDPRGRAPEDVRAIRDEVRRRVVALLHGDG